MNKQAQICSEVSDVYGDVQQWCGQIAHEGDRMQKSFWCAVTGAVESGKSTLIAVLTDGARGRPTLDNGRGSARMAVFRHKHEIESGHTSSISQHILGFDEEGGVLNYSGVAALTPAEIASSACKVGMLPVTNHSAVNGLLLLQSLGSRCRMLALTGADGWSLLACMHGNTRREGCTGGVLMQVLRFIDMGGHEKYLKTALYAMTSLLPDYMLLCVSARCSGGLPRAAREHLAVALALEIPLAVVLTQVFSLHHPAPLSMRWGVLLSSLIGT
jgi:GTPase